MLAQGTGKCIASEYKLCVMTLRHVHSEMIYSFLINRVCQYFHVLLHLIISST